MTGSSNEDTCRSWTAAGIGVGGVVGDVRGVKVGDTRATGDTSGMVSRGAVVLISISQTGESKSSRFFENSGTSSMQSKILWKREADGVTSCWLIP